MIVLPKFRYNLIFFILILSITIRWILHNYFLAPLISPDDSSQYIAIAKNIAGGNGFSLDGNEPVLHRPPFLPFFLSMLFLVFENHWLSITSAVNIFVSSITGIIVYFTTAWIINNKSANCSKKKEIPIVALLLFAINPVSIFWSGFILTESFFLFFFTLMIFYLLKALDKQDVKYFIGCGILLGFAALTRPVVLGVIPFIIIWIAFFKKSSLKLVAKLILTITVFILTILPWTTRNFLISGKIIPITSQGQTNIMYGLTEDPETHKWTLLFTTGELNSMKHLNEWEYRKVERKKLIQYIFNHPDDILRLIIKKVILFWSVTPEVERDELRSDIFIKLFMILWAMYSVIIYLFAIYGFLSIKDKTNAMIVMVMVIGFTLMYMFFIVVPEKRSRLPLEPYLIILAAIGVSSFWKRMQVHFVKHIL